MKLKEISLEEWVKALTDQDKEQIREWIGALRSGEFKQGYGHLHSIDLTENQHRFCCLGIAVKLFGKNLFLSRNNTIVGGIPAHQLGGQAEIPEWLIKITGVLFPMQTQDGRTVSLPLTVLNDGKKLDFKQIADIVEKSLL